MNAKRRETQGLGLLPPATARPASQVGQCFESFRKASAVTHSEASSLNVLACPVSHRQHRTGMAGTASIGNASFRRGSIAWDSSAVSRLNSERKEAADVHRHH